DAIARRARPAASGGGLWRAHSAAAAPPPRRATPRPPGLVAELLPTARRASQVVAADNPRVLELLLAAVALASARVDDAPAAWSHDGRYVAFDRTRPLGTGVTNASIVVVRSDGRNPRDITSTSAPFDAVRPVWSRDSRWIAFDVGSDLLPTTVQWGRRDGRS